MKKFNLVTLKTEGYRVGELKVRKEWRKACKAAVASTSLREWLEHVFTLMRTPKYAKCTPAAFDPGTGKPVSFKWVVQDDLGDFHHSVEVDVRKGGNFAEFLKPSQDEVISDLRKFLPPKDGSSLGAIPSAHVMDDKYLLVVAPCSIAIGGDQFGTTYVAGVSVTMAQHSLVSWED